MTQIFLIHILNNVPTEYDMEVKLLEERLGATTNPLSLQDIHDALNLKYMRIKKRNANEERHNDDTKEKEDMALAAGQFKGCCNYCG